MIHKIPTFFILLLLISGCASTPQAESGPRPDWVNGTAPKEYSGLKYMIAVGSGETRSQAIADAKQSISSVFSQKVESHLNSRAQSKQKEDSSANFEGDSSSETESTISIHSEITLKGVEIKRTFQDGNENMYYALAVMDRHRVKSLYQLELNRIKNKIRGLYEDQFMPQPKVSTANEILKYSDEFDAINNEYAVVNNGRGLKAPLSSRALVNIRAKATQMKREQPIILSFSGSQSEFKDLVASCLGDKQFQVVERIGKTKNPKGITVKFNLKEQKKHLNTPGWVKYEYTTSASVFKSGSSLGSTHATDTQSGRSKDMCFDKAKGSLSNKICGKIDKLVNG